MRALDWILLIFCAAIALAGPIMALQEYEHDLRAQELASVTGERPPLDVGFRAPGRLAMLIGVVVVGVLGTIVALRITAQPRVRSVSKRLLALLLAGMTLLDFAFLADARWFADVGHGGRAATIVWLYPIAAVLVGGAVARLAEVEEAFAARRPPVM